MIKQAVILAGGLGTRLRPITEKIPKPLVEVGGQPFLYWQLLELKRQGVKEVLLLVAYLGQQIEEYFTKNPIEGLNIQYAFEPEPLGTGGALKNAIAKLDDWFWLLNGDSFLKAPLQSMADFASLKKFKAVISVYKRLEQVPVPANLRLQNEVVLEYKRGAGRESGFDAVDSGVYVISRSIIEECSASKFQLEQLWTNLIVERKLGAFEVDEKFYDIGTPERLKVFEEKVCDYFKNTFSH